MKALIEIEITGDDMDNLTDDQIDEVLDEVICDGARQVYLTGTFSVKEVIKR